LPAPPESVLNDFSRTTSGDRFSMISTGVPEMPDGNAVDDSPSKPERAPVPPALKKSKLNREPSAWTP